MTTAALLSLSARQFHDTLRCARGFDGPHLGSSDSRVRRTIEDELQGMRVNSSSSWFRRTEVRTRYSRDAGRPRCRWARGVLAEDVEVGPRYAYGVARVVCVVDGAPL